MKKKRKPTCFKRLKPNEVALVADMQQKIDNYEFFVTLLHRMILRNEVRTIPETYISTWETGDIYNFVKKKIEEGNEKKGEV